MDAGRGLDRLPRALQAPHVERLVDHAHLGVAGTGSARGHADHGVPRQADHRDVLPVRGQVQKDHHIASLAEVGVRGHSSRSGSHVGAHHQHVEGFVLLRRSVPGGRRQGSRSGSAPQQHRWYDDERGGDSRDHRERHPPHPAGQTASPPTGDRPEQTPAGTRPGQAPAGPLARGHAEQAMTLAGQRGGRLVLQVAAEVAKHRKVVHRYSSSVIGLVSPSAVRTLRRARLRRERTVPIGMPRASATSS